MKRSNNLRQRAEEIARLPYSVEVALDETTDGQPVYIARIPELEGCFGQGMTIEEAVSDLQEAKIAFIESLLEDGLPVPQPSLLTKTSSASVDVSFTFTNRQETPSEVGEEKPIRLYEAALIT